MTADVAILDHTTAAALYDGHNMITGLYVEAGRGLGSLYLPTLCLAAAEATRPGCANFYAERRIRSAVQPEPLDRAAAGAVGQLVATGTPWTAAHAIHAAHPTATWPNGRTVLTRDPDAYHATGITPITVI